MKADTLTIRNRFLNALSGRTSRKVGHNTTMRREIEAGEAERVILRFHETDIIVYDGGDNSVTLDTDNHLTATTKTRLNDWLPWRVYSQDHVWRIEIDGETYMYADGMRILADGAVEGAGSEEEMKAQKKLARDIRRYAQGYAAAFVNRKVPAPSGGDCFYCLFKEVGSGRSWGEAAGMTDHLISHMEEKYFVPSLLVNAIRYSPVSMFAEDYISRVWGEPEDSGETNEHFEAMSDFLEEQLTKSVAAYMRHCLSIA